MSLHAKWELVRIPPTYKCREIVRIRVYKILGIGGVYCGELQFPSEEDFTAFCVYGGKAPVKEAGK